MKRITALLVGAVVICSMALAAGSFAASTPAKGKTKMMGSKYLIISPHTAEECMATMEKVKDNGTLSKWDFGCMDGDHTAYMITTAASAEEALKMVPENLRGQARAVKLHKFTAQELKKAHEEHAHM